MTLPDWLKHPDIALPAWLLAESARPLAWFAGQAALAAAPYAQMAGLSRWEAWAALLIDQEQYDALCRELGEQAGTVEA